jgi:DNA-directed RNA polymerase subunit beta
MPKKSVVKSNTDTNIRQDWGKKYEVLPELDLLAMQKASYNQFLNHGIGEIIQEVNPVDDFTGKNWSLTFHDHKIGKPSIDPDIALEKGLTYNSPLTVIVTLTNKKTGETHNAEVFLGDIPHMTERGTFIVNGIERAVVSQLVRFHT